MKRQQGFSLMELMIVLLIIGVIAMFAFPMYQGYLAKTQASRVVNEISALRTAMEMCILESITDVSDCNGLILNSNLLTKQTDNAAANDLSIDLTSTEAKISATLAEDAVASIKDKVVEWTRDENGTWQCQSTIEQDLLPKHCNFAESL